MELLENKTSITSLELVKQINIFRAEDIKKSELGHNDLLKIIRDEFEEEFSLGFISQSEYISDRGQTYPMFVLSLSQAKQVLVKESKIVRKAVIAHIEKLESLIAKPIPKTHIELIIESAMAVKAIEDKQLEQDNKINALDAKITDIIATRQLALEHLEDVTRSTEVVPEIGIRLKCNQLVRKYAEKHSLDFQDVWRSMYTKMLYTYRFNVNAYKKLHAKETKLDIIERENQLDNLYALISKEL